MKLKPYVKKSFTLRLLSFTSFFNEKTALKIYF